MTGAARILRRVATLAAAAALGGCAAGSVTEARYRMLLADYEAAGRLRTELAPEDAPFDNAALIRNFERIAFHTEFAPSEGALVAREAPVRLFRWIGPLRWRLDGDAATAEDRATMLALMARIERLTGLDVAEASAEEEPTLLILVATERYRRGFVEMMDRSELSDRMRLVREWARDDRFPCVGQVGRAEGAGVTRGLIVVKAETRGLLRRSCLHEETVQSLGLLNDDPGVRPSIFNDDQEFALLTRHDEYLLRILYDPRLSPGMSAARGMPIVRRIVEDIGPDGHAVAGGPPPPPPGL